MITSNSCIRDADDIQEKGMCEAQALSLDTLVKERLKRWPQRPPGLRMPRGGRHVWLRGRPGDDSKACHPFIKVPGSSRLRTVPDGLWLNFGGTVGDSFVDIFAIEACSTLQNLYDKRSRFAATTHSLLVECPAPWLLGSVMGADDTPRWQAIGLLARRPILPVVFPVRFCRILYALTAEHYAGFARHQLPHGHEFFAPMDALIAEDSDRNPDLLALLHRASPVSNFLRQA